MPNPVDVLKFSPNGRYLATCSRFAAVLYDFDIATGRITDPRTISDPRPGSRYHEAAYAGRRAPQSYGLEFSPSSELLYVVTFGPGDDPTRPMRDVRFLQFDLRGRTQEAIANSVSVIYRSTDDRIRSIAEYGGHMQLAVDGRIWFNARTGLDVIPYPDRLGTACGYLPAYIPIPEWGSLRNHAGFPTVIASDLGLGKVGSTCRPPWPTLTSDTVCVGECATLAVSSVNGATSIRWFAGSGRVLGPDDADTVRICHDTPGTYTVRAVVRNGYGVDEAETQIVVLPRPSVRLDGDNVVCQGGDAVFTASGADTLHWYVNGAPIGIRGGELRLRNVSTTTVVGVRGRGVSSTCTDSAQLVLRVDSARVSVTPDTVICRGSSITLLASGNGDVVWHAEDGSLLGVEPSLLVAPLASTVYRALVTTARGCTDTAVVRVRVNEPPNVEVNGDTTVCPGTVVTVSATPGYRYRWWPEDIVSKPTSAAPSVAVDTTTRLYVEITDTTGCSIVDSVLITVRSAGWVRLGSDTTVCRGAELSLASISEGGLVEWVDAGTGEILQIGDQLQMTTERSLTIVARLANETCARADTLRIDVKDRQQLVAGPDTTICAGGTVLLRSNAGSTARWLDDDGVPVGRGASISVTPSQTSTYWLTDDCADTVAVMVTVAQPRDLDYVIGSASVPVGDPVEVVIDMQRGTASGTELVIGYDGRLLSLLEVVGARLIDVRGIGTASTTAQILHTSGDRIILRGSTMLAPVTSTTIAGAPSTDSCGSVVMHPGTVTVHGCGLPMRSILAAGAAMESATFDQASDVINAVMSIHTADRCAFEMFDATGACIWRFHATLDVGSTTLALPVSTVPAGVYALRCITSIASATQMICIWR